MGDARVALTEIFETVLFLGKEGLPFRENYDVTKNVENSKFMSLLQLLKANDIPELASWLKNRLDIRRLHYKIMEES